MSADTPTPFGVFNILPRDVKNIIYSKCLTRCSVLSKDINKEVQPIIDSLLYTRPDAWEICLLIRDIIKIIDKSNYDIKKLNISLVALGLIWRPDSHFNNGIIIHICNIETNRIFLEINMDRKFYRIRVEDIILFPLDRCVENILAYLKDYARCKHTVCKNPIIIKSRYLMRAILRRRFLKYPVDDISSKDYILMTSTLILRREFDDLLSLVGLPFGIDEIVCSTGCVLRGFVLTMDEPDTTLIQRTNESVFLGKNMLLDQLANQIITGIHPVYKSKEHLLVIIRNIQRFAGLWSTKNRWAITEVFLSSINGKNTIQEDVILLLTCFRILQEHLYEDITERVCLESRNGEGYLIHTSLRDKNGELRDARWRE